MTQRQQSIMAMEMEVMAKLMGRELIYLDHSITIWLNKMVITIHNFFLRTTQFRREFSTKSINCLK